MYHIFCATFDALRTVTGPLPYAICNVNIFVKNLVHINLSFITLSATFAKFVFVCIYKSIPHMDDNLLTRVIYLTSNLIAIIGAAAKLYLPGRPLLNVVCIQFIELIIDVETNILLSKIYLLFSLYRVNHMS